MKKHVRLFIMLFAGLLIAGCGARTLYIQVLKPAQITLPKDIKSIVIANRSIASKENRAGNIVEGVFSGEGLFVDRFGSEECIKGLSYALNRSGRYAIKVPSDLNLPGLGTGVFPEPLSWNEVEEICAKYGTDALLTLETFDSDTKIVHGEKKKTKTVNEKTVNYIEYSATLEIRVKTGWRIYYPKTKRILDSRYYTDYKSWSAIDESLVGAEKKLPPLDQAVNQTGYYAGDQYSIRIVPTWIRVSRTYFKKGNDDFKKASRLVEKNEWESAANIWEKHLESSDSKIAGRAHHNMAVALEMQGDLDGALEFAKAAYFEFNEKKSRYYINALKVRISDRAKLEQQLD